MDRTIYLLFTRVVNFFSFIILNCECLMYSPDYSKNKKNFSKACRNGSMYIVRDFINNKDIHSYSKYFYSEGLSEACIHRKNNIMKILINYKPECINISDSNLLRTSFHYACISGNIELLELLLKYDVDIHKIDSLYNDGFTYACKKGNMEMIKILYKLLYSGEYNGGYISKIFNKLGIRVYNPSHSILSGFLTACKYNNIRVVKYLLDKGVDINAKNSKGLNSLMIACISGNIDMMKFLIHKNSNIHNVDMNNHTLLYHCCYNMRFDYDTYLKILKLILSAGYNYKSEINCDYMRYNHIINNYIGTDEYYKLKYDLYIKNASDIFALIIKHKIFYRSL